MQRVRPVRTGDHTKTDRERKRRRSTTASADQAPIDFCVGRDFEIVLELCLGGYMAGDKTPSALCAVPCCCAVDDGVSIHDNTFAKLIHPLEFSLPLARGGLVPSTEGICVYIYNTVVSY